MLKSSSLLAAVPGFLLAVSVALSAENSDTVYVHETGDVKPDLAVRWGRLDNGLRYAIRANANPHGRASLRLGVLVGSLHETEQQRGLAHFLEHLAFNGSTHWPPGALPEYLQRLGMSTGSDTNAVTAPDRTIYQLELPDVRHETLQQALTVFADFADGLLLKPESIEKERGIILSEARERDSLGARAWRERSRFIAPEALLTQREPIGVPEVIRSANRESFVDFYDAWYRPERLVVVAVGDFDVGKVEEQLTRLLAPLAARGPARPTPDLGRAGPPGTVTAGFYRQPQAPAVRIAMDVLLPYTASKDSTARRVQEMPAKVAVALLNARLMNLARKDDSAIAGGRVEHVRRAFNFLHVLSVDWTCRQATQWRACIAAVEQDLRRALEHGFQPAELQEVVAGIRNEFVQRDRMAGSRTSSELAHALLGSILDEVVFTHPSADRALIEPVLGKITAADCTQALRGLLGAGVSPYLFVSGDLHLKEEDIVAAYTTSARQPVAAVQASTQASFAYGQTGQAGEVMARREVADLGLTLLEFKNGVRLNLKRTEFETGRVRVAVRLGGGILSAPRDKPGLSTLVARAFIDGGLGKHSIEELRTLLAGRTVEYDFEVGSDAFWLSGSTTPDDLLLQLQVLNAFVSDPGYRPDALRQFRMDLDPMYTRLAYDIAGPQSTQIPLLMVKGDARFGLPEKQVMRQRTLEEAKLWLGPQFARGAIEISVVGDLDIERAILAVMRTFGALSAREAKPAYEAERRLSFPERPLRKEYHIATDLPRALIDMRWPATDDSDARRSQGITVLAGVFADRLRAKLREQMGQAYGPAVRAQLTDAFPGYGVIVAIVSAAPDQARIVADVLQNVAADLAANGITEDELKRIKEPLLTQWRTAQQDNGYWLRRVLAGAQEFPRRLDRHRSSEADLRAVNVAAVNALARTYLNPKRASQFIMLPQSKIHSPSTGLRPGARSKFSG